MESEVHVFLKKEEIHLEDNWKEKKLTVDAENIKYYIDPGLQEFNYNKDTNTLSPNIWNQNTIEYIKESQKEELEGIKNLIKQKADYTENDKKKIENIENRHKEELEYAENSLIENLKYLENLEKQQLNKVANFKKLNYLTKLEFIDQKSQYKYTLLVCLKDVYDINTTTFIDFLTAILKIPEDQIEIESCWLPVLDRVFTYYSRGLIAHTPKNWHNLDITQKIIVDTYAPKITLESFIKLNTYFKNQIRLEKYTTFQRLYITNLDYPLDLLFNLFMEKKIIITYLRGGIKIRGQPLEITEKGQILNNLTKFDDNNISSNSEFTNNDQILYIDIYSTIDL